MAAAAASSLSMIAMIGAITLITPAATLSVKAAEKNNTDIADVSWVHDYTDEEAAGYADYEESEKYFMLFSDVWDMAFELKDSYYPDYRRNEAVMAALDSYMGINMTEDTLLSGYIQKFYENGYLEKEDVWELGFSDAAIATWKKGEYKEGIMADDVAAGEPEYDACEAYTAWTTDAVHYRALPGTEYGFAGDLDKYEELTVTGTTEKNGLKWCYFTTSSGVSGFITDKCVTAENPGNRTFSYYDFESGSTKTLTFMDEDPYKIDRIIEEKIEQNNAYIGENYDYPVENASVDAEQESSTEDSPEESRQDETGEQAEEKEKHLTAINILNVLEVISAVFVVVSVCGIITVVAKEKKKKTAVRREN